LTRKWVSIQTVGCRLKPSDTKKQALSGEIGFTEQIYQNPAYGKQQNKINRFFGVLRPFHFSVGFNVK